jgi:copper(I)-binding protein
MIGPLQGPLIEGETLAITLRFERAGEVTVEFEVEAANATAPD